MGDPGFESFLGSFLGGFQGSFLGGFFSKVFGEEFVGDLCQDADTVAHFAGSVLAGPVFKLLHNVQGVVQNPVVLPAVNIYNTSDAAGIMFLLVPHNSPQ